MSTKTEQVLKVSIIIINWNGKRFLENCIDSIKASDLDRSHYEIIVADNLSSDNSVILIKERYPWVRLIEFKDNYGFCKGNNQAALLARGEYLFFLNNDTRIEPYTIRKMLERIEGDEKIAICGCKILNYNGTKTFHTGIGIDFLGWPVLNKRLFYVEGSALMIRKSVFDLLGGFDEDYFMFHEDVDLCWRTRLLGYRTEAVDDAIVYHFMGASAGGGEADKKGDFRTTTFRRYHSEKNTINTLIKNYSFVSLILIMPLYFFVSLSECAIFFFLGKFNVVKAYLNAYKWNIENMGRTFSKRMEVQKNRKVSDIEILSHMYKSFGKLLTLKEFGLPKVKG